MTPNGTEGGTAQKSAATPDGPVDFGWKSEWLAFKTTRAEEVVEALSLTNVRPSGWEDGLEAACGFDLSNDPRVFVSPPIRGWTLAAGDCLPSLDTCGAQGDRLTPLLLHLRQRFPEIHYFGTCRIVGFSAWAKMKDGVIVRAFSCANGAGLMCNHGALTEEEVALGFQDCGREVTNSDGHAYIAYPGESGVLALAGRWSVNPALLTSMGLGPGLGWLGRWGAADPVDTQLA